LDAGFPASKLRNNPVPSSPSGYPQVSLSGGVPVPAIGSLRAWLIN
jgi:hypothetical protein